MLALTAHWCELADFFLRRAKTCAAELIARPRPYTSKLTPVSLLRTQMGLKFNFRAIPLHWRLLIGVQLGLSGAIMAYRQRVLAVKAKQQE